MSGFEIAGSVLAAFPLLLEGARSLSNVFQKFQYWLKFEAEFEKFLMDIEEQYIAYSQMLELLLDPLEAIQHHHREALKADPASLLWRDADVCSALKDRLQERYTWFMNNLRAMNQTLHRLYELLPIGQAHVINSTDVKSTLSRLDISFFSEKDRLLAEITAKNKTLYKFLKKEFVNIKNARSIISPVAAIELTHVMSVIEHQERARLVLDSLRQNWACSLDCIGSHPCCVSVHGDDMKAFLSSGEKQKHVRFEWRHTREIVDPKKPVPDTTPTIKHKDVAGLTQQVGQIRGMEKLKTEVPETVLKLTQSTLLALSRPFDPHADDVDQKGLERPAKRLRKRPKRVKTEPGALPLQIAPAPALHQPPGPREDTSAIANMCRTIAQECDKSCLGFFDMPTAKLYLHLEPRSEISFFRATSLRNFIDNTPESGVRLGLGHTVTKIILRLGPAWMPDQWQQSWLLLLRTPGLVPQPYISLPAIPTATQSTSTLTANKAGTSLLRLGILLLELLFGETLESQPFRTTYLDGGMPNDMTDFCTAFKWQKMVEKKFGLELARAISRCIGWFVDPLADLGSPEFVRTVWALVVHPLEKWIQDYLGPTDASK